jgi:predicted flap endonuclease-1-like 5' DNA nuclease
VEEGEGHVEYKISEIEGIGAIYAEKLAAVGIQTTEDFLTHCSDPKGRKRIADETGLSPKRILTWANLSDLMRISGIGPEYSELLEAAGVDTVKELRHRNAANLAEKMAEVNETKKLTRAVPPPAAVQKWVDLAKETDPRITH